jgi:hypothetical protein
MGLGYGQSWYARGITSGGSYEQIVFPPMNSLMLVERKSTLVRLILCSLFFIGHDSWHLFSFRLQSVFPFVSDMLFGHLPRLHVMTRH